MCEAPEGRWHCPKWPTMQGSWAWHTVQCVTCHWWWGLGNCLRQPQGNGRDEDEKSVLGSIGGTGGSGCWAWCTPTARPLARSWRHESRLQLGAHEHMPDTSGKDEFEGRDSDEVIRSLQVILKKFFRFYVKI